MKKAFLVLIAVFSAFLVVGCAKDAAADDYGGEVKDSGGTPVAPGKAGAQDVSIDQ